MSAPSRDASGQSIRVTAACIRRANTVLICRRPPGDVLAGKWEFPGGKIESGETPEKCLARELHEELGLRGRVGNFLMAVDHSYCGKRIELLFYEVSCGGEVSCHSAHDRVEWAPVEALPTYELAPADVPFAEWLTRSWKSSA